MTPKPTIESIKCHKVINSRGDWTIEAHIQLTDGSIGIQPVPDGASKGENEAVYIPVEKAVDVVAGPINDALIGHDPFDQAKIDKTLIDMDGSPNKHNLGGNSILAISLGAAKACAVSKKVELYKHLKDIFGNDDPNVVFPTPVFNILNGGKHAHNGLSFQEFMVIPSPKFSIERSLEMGVEIYQILKEKLESDGFSTGVGDEGGFAPGGFTVDKALTYIRDAASTKFTPGSDIFFGMDVAAESFYDHQSYNISEENLALNIEGFKNYYTSLLSKYELIYIEDPYYEGDHEGWELFNKTFGSKLMVVADDLVVTNPKFLKDAIKKNLANAVIVKPNQVGSLTETFEFINLARDNNMNIIISHRSGETGEDTFISDLAVAVKAEFMKSGAPARGERVVKYNRLLEIYSLMSLVSTSDDLESSKIS